MSWFRKVRLNGGASIISFAFTTRASVRSNGGDLAHIGSIATSTTDGRTYIKIANNAADADWAKVTATNAD
jgi:hypothetical protein